MNLKVTKHSSDTLTEPESLNRRAVAQNNPEKKQFLTRAQRDWKPGMKKKSRSVKVMFTSTILVLEAFVAFFGTLAVFGHHFSDPVEIKILIWAVGLTVAAVLMLLPAQLKSSWGYTAGWVLQVALLALSALTLPLTLIVVVGFVGCWWYGLRAGTRLDAENKAREAEQAEWERQHPQH